MKYLFFDIECSNCFGGVGKMCEFGYVLMDEEFNVMSRDDIPMSPGRGRENKFHLTGRKHEKDLVLAYTEDLYLSQPEFPTFYDRIKSLMEDSDTVCFAFSMDNDIPHLHHACTRYKLKSMNYECYDVQKLVAAYLETKGQMSLHNACQKIVGPNSMVRLHEHLSRDDAMMEKMIFQAICELTKKKPSELLQASEFAKTNSLEWMEMVEERARIKKEKTAAYDLFRSETIPDEDIDKEEYVGRRFTISGSIKGDMEMLKETIRLIKEKGGVITNRTNCAEFFVVRDETNKEELQNIFKSEYKGLFVLYDDLWALREAPINR